MCSGDCGRSVVKVCVYVCVNGNQRGTFLCVEIMSLVRETKE